MRTTTYLIFWLCICASQGLAQKSPYVYQVDRSVETKTCYLPAIYFKVNSSEIEEGYLEEMAFIAHTLKKFKKIKLRLNAEVAPNPYDIRTKLLTQERMSYFIWLMKDKFGIQPKRIIQPQYTQITRGYDPYEKALAMDKRKLGCDCVWEGK